MDKVGRMSGGPEILLHLDRSHPETLTGQLRSGLRDAVRNRRLPAGTRLPASRVLAQDLSVSRGVVVDAYAQLVAEGFLVTRPGSATVVSDAVGTAAHHPSWFRSRRDRRRLWRPELDLRPAGPDLTLFPRSQAARTFAEVIRYLPAAELGYTGPWGVARLREQLAAHLSRVRAAMAPADGIVVVTGGTQALTIIARALAAVGHGHIAVEDPGDPVHRHLLQVHGLKAGTGAGRRRGPGRQRAPANRLPRRPDQPQMPVPDRGGDVGGPAGTPAGMGGGLLRPDRRG